MAHLGMFQPLSFVIQPVFPPSGLSFLSFFALLSDSFRTLTNLSPTPTVSEADYPLGPVGMCQEAPKVGGRVLATVEFA